MKIGFCESHWIGVVNAAMPNRCSENASVCGSR